MKIREEIQELLESGNIRADEYYFKKITAPPLLSFLSPWDIQYLHKLATSVKLSAKIDYKYEEIDKVMESRGFVRMGRGTNRAVYRHLENKAICCKVAVDDIGIRDNPREFINQDYLYPFVCKIFEVDPTGTVAIVERVDPITNRDEFASIANKIFDLIRFWFTGKYVMDDIGVDYFMNWGTRVVDGCPVLLDYPYMYELDYHKLFCQKPEIWGPCGGVIDYDEGYNKLRCCKCGAAYRAPELAKAIRSGIIIDKEADKEMKRVIKVTYTDGSVEYITKDPVAGSIQRRYEEAEENVRRAVRVGKVTENHKPVEAPAQNEDEDVSTLRMAKRIGQSYNVNKDEMKEAVSRVASRIESDETPEEEPPVEDPVKKAVRVEEESPHIWAEKVRDDDEAYKKPLEVTADSGVLPEVSTAEDAEASEDEDLGEVEDDIPFDQEEPEDEMDGGSEESEEDKGVQEEIPADSDDGDGDTEDARDDEEVEEVIVNDSKGEGGDVRGGNSGSLYSPDSKEVTVNGDVHESGDDDVNDIEEDEGSGKSDAGQESVSDGRIGSAHNITLQGDFIPKLDSTAAATVIAEDNVEDDDVEEEHKMVTMEEALKNATEYVESHPEDFPQPDAVMEFSHESDGEEDLNENGDTYLDEEDPETTETSTSEVIEDEEDEEGDEDAFPLILLFGEPSLYINAAISKKSVDNEDGLYVYFLKVDKNNGDILTIEEEMPDMDRWNVASVITNSEVDFDGDTYIDLDNDCFEFTEDEMTLSKYFQIYAKN